MNNAINIKKMADVVKLENSNFLKIQTESTILEFGREDILKLMQVINASVENNAHFIIQHTSGYTATRMNIKNIILRNMNLKKNFYILKMKLFGFKS